MSFDSEQAFAMEAVLHSETFSSYKSEDVTLTPLGVGGCGAVYQIKIGGKQTKRIIKVPLFKNLELCIERLYDEIDVLEQVHNEVDSKNVLRIFEHSTIEYDGKEICYYIAEELIKIPRNNEPENDIFLEVNPRHPDQKRFSEQQVCSFIMDITQALCDVRDSFAQAEESVKTAHRDIKLENILYSEDEIGRRVYKLIDFGLFKHYSGHTMGGDTRIGTAFTMAPERFLPNQKNGKKGITHPANDIFGLAYVLYKLLSKSGLPLVDVLKNEVTGTNYRRIEGFDEANETFLKDLYGIDISSYYSNHRGVECLPREQLFDSKHLHGSSELRSIVRSMFHMDYKERPSAEDVQIMVLQLIDKSNIVINVEDFEECSGYGLYQDIVRDKKAKDDINARRSNRNNTESLPRDEDTPDHSSKPSQEEAEHISRAKKPEGLFLYISIWLESIVNISVMALPLLSFTAYEKLIEFITGGKPLYSEDEIYFYIFPLIAALITRLIILPIAYRAIISLKYKSNETIRIRLILLGFAIVAAISMGIHDYVHLCNNLPEQLNVSSLCFVIRREFEALLTTAFSICAIYIIYRDERYMAYYEIKKPINNKLRFSDGFWDFVFLIIPLVLLFITPCFKLLFSLFETGITDYAKEWLALKNTLTPVANEYVDDQKAIYVMYNNFHGASFGFSVPIYGVFIAFPMHMVLYYSIEYFIGRPMKCVTFRNPHTIQRNSKNSRFHDFYLSFPFSELWKKLNKTALCKLEVKSYDLSSEDVSLIAKGMEEAIPDEKGHIMKDENGETIVKYSGIKTLETVNLDNNSIGEIDTWNSHNIKVFSARNCSLYLVDGLRTLNFLEKLDLSNNRIDDISFIVKSHASKTLQYLDISYNLIPEEQVEHVVSKCHSLVTLIMDNCNTSEWTRSIGFLSGLTKLNTFSAKFLKIDDLSPLKGKALSSLSLVCGHISDISVLGEDVLSLYSDTTLNLKDNEITDIKPLPAKTYKELILSGNPITDFSHLSNLDGETVEISYADTDDFLDQLDYMYGFKSIIIIDVPVEMEGLIERKLIGKKHSISAKAHDD